MLWCGIAALLQRRPELRLAIYTGDSVTPEEILRNVRDRFGLALPAEAIEFVYLTQRCAPLAPAPCAASAASKQAEQHAWGGRSWVEAANYPALTLLGQSLGSLVLALEAVLRLPPPLFIDTTGYAFSFPIARYVAGCSVACYVHYPTISTDMLAAVAERRPAHNNAASIASSPARSQLKLLYYKLFARLYALVGRRADVVMARTALDRQQAGLLAGL